jgi:hypothetical protein
MHYGATTPVIGSAHLIALASSKSSRLELMSPFLFTILLLLVSISLMPSIIAQLRRHLTEGWTAQELQRVAPDRNPATHALAATWIVATPALGLITLRDGYTSVFIGGYGAMFFGVAFFLWFIRRVRILTYSRLGVVIAGYSISPIVLAGLMLNLVAAVTAGFLTM